MRQYLFRPEAKKKVMADLYKVKSLDGPVLENGKAVQGEPKPVAYQAFRRRTGADNVVDPLTSLLPGFGRPRRR